jgi:tRNA-2-methylthio-N6-dimethylallyladenosine synthase
VSVEVTYAAPHHLVADVVHSVRRTRAGDAWQARQDSPARQPVGVLLGMPALPPARI